MFNYTRSKFAEKEKYNSIITKNKLIITHTHIHKYIDTQKYSQMKTNYTFSKNRTKEKTREKM